MTNSKLVVAALAALSLTAGNAFAQDEGDPCGDPCAGDPCGGGEGEATGDGTGEGTATTATGDGDGDMDAAEGIDGYPQAVIDRPGVLPQGVLELTGSLPIAYVKIGETSSTSLGLGIGARYGLAPKIDAQLTYGIALKEFEAKGPLGVVGQFSLIEDEKLRIAARVSTGINLNGINDEGEATVKFSGIGLGLNLQYKITPKIAVFTNGDHISIGFADGVKPVAINLPFGFGFQASDALNVFVKSSIGTIGLSPSGNTLISDATPFAIGATFSPSNKLDIGATADLVDIQNAGDIFLISLMAAFRM